MKHNNPESQFSFTRTALSPRARAASDFLSLFLVLGLSNSATSL
jgi:hypothetical protein